VSTTKPRQRAFLAAYRLSASVTKAAKAAGVDRVMHYRWLAEDEDYKRQFAEAHDEAGQHLEDEAVERASVGVFVPNVFQGQFVYLPKDYVEKDGKRVLKPGAKPLGVWQKSDRLLEFLLKGFKPEKYRERTSTEITGAGGGVIEVKFVTPPEREA
jgi:hypothetical protein